MEGEQMRHISHVRATGVVSFVQVAVFVSMVATALAVPFLPTARAAATVSVEIANYSFNPSTITISPGDTVIWYNNQTGVHHSVTSDTGVTPSFDSGEILPGATWSNTFDTEGTFTYHCMYHTYMHGTVIVGTAIPEFSSSILVVAGTLALMLGLIAIRGRR
jgi:plastocyanin